MEVRIPVISLMEVMDEQLAQKLAGSTQKFMSGASVVPLASGNVWCRQPEISKDTDSELGVGNKKSSADLLSMTAMGLDPIASSIALQLSASVEQAVALCLDSEVSQLQSLMEQKKGAREKVLTSCEVVSDTFSQQYPNKNAGMLSNEDDFNIALALHEHELEEYQKYLKSHTTSTGNQSMDARRLLTAEDAEQREEYSEDDENKTHPSKKVFETTGVNAKINVQQTASVIASYFDHVGDVESEVIFLSKSSSNSLKQKLRKKQSLKGQSARGRVSGDTRQTRGGVLDQATEMLLFKLQNQQMLTRIHGVVKTGKEAHILYAKGRMDIGTISQDYYDHLAIKIFKTTLNKFSNRSDYIDGDARYGNLKFNKQARKTMFKLWAEKEHRNLLRAYSAGVSCPQPARQIEHILVMEFIGNDGWPASQLQEMELSESSAQSAYVQVIEECRKLFQDAALVHADLSEYNILYQKKKIFLIDFGQAVEKTHQDAFFLLERDLNSVNRFFQNKEVTILPTEIALRFVINCKNPGASLLERALNWIVTAKLRCDSNSSCEKMIDALLVEEGGAEVITSPEEVKQSVEYSHIKRENSLRDT